MKNQELLERFHRLLDGRSLDISSPVFRAAVDFLKNFPGELPESERSRLRERVMKSFNLTEEELTAAYTGTFVKRAKAIQSRALENEKELDALLPKEGFFRRYIEYTRHSEAPLAYHFYCALIGIASIVNRRAWFDMGYFRIYPALGVILLGPSGIKKTSASDIIVKMVTELEITKVYSEKLTPEALIEAMKETAQGLIYAPEMVVFLGKQKYNEGLVELITRFFDCPDKWESGTIMRGKHFLTDIAISSLMCSTMDWFIKNVPEETFGGGFIARNILVLQTDSPRIEPKPRPGDPSLYKKLLADLAHIHELANGEVIMTEECDAFYESWYCEHKEKSKNPEHELLATYYQRKPSHIIRVAMCIHFATHGNLELCSSCFKQATDILGWTEKFLPGMMKELFKSQAGQDHNTIIKIIQSTGGAIDHSTLIRKTQYRMNAATVRAIISSLKEAGMVKEVRDNVTHCYTIIGEEG